MKRIVRTLVALAVAWPLMPVVALAEEPVEPHLVRLTLGGVVTETKSAQLDLFGSAGARVELSDVAEAIRSAATDPAVRGLVLRLRGAAMGRSQREALRRELLRFRDSGKPSYCFLESAGTGDYLLASAAGQVSLAPAGTIEIPGVGLQKIYFKGLLEKVGIRMQELRMGRYKSAVEPFTREGTSRAVREETESLLDELYEDLVGALAENLGRDRVLVRALIDRGLYTAREAKEAGLVHHVEFEDAMLARVRGDEEIAVRRAKLGDAPAYPAPGFAGMMQLMNELFSPSATPKSDAPKIAIVHATGAIESGGGVPNPLTAGQSITSNEMVPLLRRLRGDPAVLAVVLRVDSPGGSALASDLIAREVALTAKSKPLVVSMADLAASGGYYISAPATWIVAENTTLTGSIGVIGGVLDLRGAYDRAGIRVEAFTRGKSADLTDPYGRLSEAGRERLLGFMRKIYDRFLEIVAEGRGMEVSAVASIAEGRVWTGGQAAELGLVDQVGSLEDALAKARELAGAPEDVEWLHLPEPKTLFDLLSGGEPAEAALRAAVHALPQEVRSVLERISWVWSLRRERVLAVMPELIDVR